MPKIDIKPWNTLTSIFDEIDIEKCHLGFTERTLYIKKKLDHMEGSQSFACIFVSVLFLQLGILAEHGPSANVSFSNTGWAFDTSKRESFTLKPSEPQGK